MPVYNAEKYVGEAVESILNQTFGDFEFLIIDDGSTDRSLEILRRYEKQDSRIRLVSRPNTGLVAALNEMLTLSTGELIARMDADDISLPHRFEKQVAFLRSNPGYVVVGSRVMLMDSHGCDIMPFREQTTHEEIDQMHLENCGGAVICHPTAMMRRQSLVSVGGYNTQAWPAEDLALFLRLAEVGRVANLASVELKYRLHHASTSVRHRALQVDVMNRVVAEARSRRGLPARAAGDAVVSVPCRSDRHQTWAWWALRAGHIRTARKHALAAWLRKPWSPATWRVLACATRGN